MGYHNLLRFFLSLTAFCLILLAMMQIMLVEQHLGAGWTASQVVADLTGSDLGGVLRLVFEIAATVVLVLINRRLPRGDEGAPNRQD